MSTTEVVENTGTTAIDKINEAGKVDDTIDKDKNVISEDIAIQILNRKEQEFEL